MGEKAWQSTRLKDSLKQKRGGDSEIRNKALLGTGALLGGSVVAGNIQGNSVYNYLNQSENLTKMKENPELLKKIGKLAKKQGITVYENQPVSAYAGMPAVNLINKIKGIKGNTDAILLRGNTSGKFGEIGILGEMSNPVSASEFAHELGHAQFVKGRKGNIIGKISTALHGPSSYLVQNPKMQVLPIIDGYFRGRRSVKTDENGDINVNNKKLIKSGAIGAAISTPLLATEGLASAAGYNALKRLGASKEYLKKSRKAMGNSFGTYAALSLIPVTGEIGGNLLGAAHGKYLAKKKQKSTKSDS